MKRLAAAPFIAAALFLSGCGYTTQTLLPADVRSVHVQPVKNAIDLTAEVGDDERFRVYRPGVEVDVTNAIINRFIFDGTLQVEGPETADAVLEAKLIDYRRDPLRYSENDDVQEYRLSVFIEATLYKASDRSVIWKDSALAGDTTFFLSGPRAIGEDQAVAVAVEDLARRVVEKTVEIW
jgi:outer membrane lipopolysaccharide assembly protein LptE/RlpB